MMDEELKPCPFCGGKAFIDCIYHPAREAYKWHARGMCGNCSATSGGTAMSASKQEAIERAVTAWNRRAGDTP